MMTKKRLRQELVQKDLEISRLTKDLAVLQSAKRRADPLPPCKDFGCYGCMYASILYDHSNDSYTLMGCMRDSFCKDFCPRPDKKIELLGGVSEAGR